MKIGVIGAGAMGAGIAQTFAESVGVDCVYLCDTKKEFAERGVDRIKKELEKKVDKGKLVAEDRNRIMCKLHPGLNSQCADTDFIIEAAVEVLEIKRACFRELQEKIVKNRNCIYATNTSSLSITEISEGLSRAVVGMHFFNPAPVMKLVEVIPGLTTLTEDVEKTKELAEQLQKTPVQVEESAGFVVNRLLIPMINEAVGLYEAEISNIVGIDSAMKLGANFPMGPLELGDFIGWDICLNIMDVIYEETKDSKYRASPLMRKMVRGKNLGRKTGKGFYIYQENRKYPIDASCGRPF